MLGAKSLDIGNLAKVIRVAIYARVSTEEQAEHGYSIDAQLDNLREYCKLHNKEVAGEYVDRGISGKEMTKRHELQRLLRDAELGKFDEVIVWKINRMSRKTKDLLEIVELLGRNNVCFRSFSENFETSTPMGRLGLQIMGGVGEFERSSIVENVKMGMKQRAKMGYHNGGACLGYKTLKLLDGNSNNQQTRLAIVPEEALVVRKMFELYAAGKGFRAIANQLNHEGHKTKKGNTFGGDSIREIITNPIYVGTIRYNRFEGWSEKRRRGKNSNPILTEGKHEAIIDKDLWEKVQALFAQKSKACPRVYDSGNLLTGLIRCPECGTPMVISRSHYKLRDGTKTAQRYYSCGSFKSKGSAVCHANSVRADYAEAYVLNRIKKILKHPRMLTDIVSAVNNKRAGGADSLAQELIAVENNLEQLVNRKRKILDVYEIYGMDRDTLSMRLEELTEKTKRLQARKSEIESDMGGEVAQEVPLELVRDLLEKLDGIIERSSPEQKKAMLHLAIKEITLVKSQETAGMALKRDRKIGTIFMKLGNELQTFLQEGPSTVAAVEGSFSYLRKKRRKTRPIYIQI